MTNRAVPSVADVALVGQPDGAQTGLGVLALVDVDERRVLRVEGERGVEVADRKRDVGEQARREQVGGTWRHLDCALWSDDQSRADHHGGHGPARHARRGPGDDVVPVRPASPPTRASSGTARRATATAARTRPWSVDRRRRRVRPVADRCSRWCAVEPLAERMRLFTRRRLGEQLGRRARPQRRRAGAVGRPWQDGRAGRCPPCSAGCVTRSRCTRRASSSRRDRRRSTSNCSSRCSTGASRRSRCASGPSGAGTWTRSPTLRAALDPGVELMVDGSEIFTLPTAQDVARRTARRSASRGSRSRCRRATAPASSRWPRRRRCRSPTASTSSASTRRSTPCAAASCRCCSPTRPPAAAWPRRARWPRRRRLRRPRGSSRVRRAGLAGGQPALRRHRAGDPRRSSTRRRLAEAWSTFGVGLELGPKTIVDGTLPVPDGPASASSSTKRQLARNPYRPPGPASPGPCGGLPDRFVGDR